MRKCQFYLLRIFKKGEYDLLHKQIGLIYQNVKNLQVKHLLKHTESDFHLSRKEVHNFNLQNKHPLPRLHHGN